MSAASATSLSVSWAPPDNAGPPITGYDVQYRAGTSGGMERRRSHNGTAPTATLTGLSENTSYQVQVRANQRRGHRLVVDLGQREDGRQRGARFQIIVGVQRGGEPDHGGHGAGDGLRQRATTVTGYTITGGADRRFFSIGATSGALTFDAAPNYEDCRRTRGPTTPIWW